MMEIMMKFMMKNAQCELALNLGNSRKNPVQ